MEEVSRKTVSSYISEADIQRLLQAVDIVELVGTYVALKPKGKEMLGLCPFHDDKKPSLSVSAGKQIYKCFACGAGGNAITFIMLRERLTFPEAVELLADRVGLQLTRRENVVSEEGSGYSRGDLEGANRWAARYFRGCYEDESQGRQAREYVEGRGIEEGMGRRFGIGWAADSWDELVKAAGQDGPSSGLLEAVGLVQKRESGGTYDRFRCRLMFPVLDAMGRVIAFGGRTLGDDPAKYLNSPESALFDKSRTIYGIHAGKDAIVRSRTAVVVEGYTDCLMAHQFGLENVVATLGTALTSEHARGLSRYADRIVLLFDGDAAGEKAADRAIEIFFSQQIEVRLASLPNGMDPCDFLQSRGKEAFEELIEGSVEALDYKWRRMSERLEAADTVNGRRQATEEFLESMTSAMEQGQVDEISRGFILNHIAKLTGRSAEVVHAKANRLHGRRFRAQAAEGGGKMKMLPADSYLNSEREILEVLLNRTDMLEQVREFFGGADEFRGELHRIVARRLWDGVERGAEGLGELLGSCDDPEIARVMTDMAYRGQQRGNFESTLGGALSNIGLVRGRHERENLREMVSSVGQEFGSDTEAAMLMDIQARISPDQRKAGPR